MEPHTFKTHEKGVFRKALHGVFGNILRKGGGCPKSTKNAHDPNM